MPGHHSGGAINVPEGDSGGFRRILKPAWRMVGAMRLWPDGAARAALAVIALGALWAALAGRGGIPPARIAPALLVVAGASLLCWTRFSRVHWRRIGPALDPNAPSGREKPSPSGAFTWTPVGQPVPYEGYATRLPHRWWDAERGPSVQTSVAFDVPDAVTARELHVATRTALRAATAALPGRGKVRASAAVRDVAGPTSLVRVRLQVRGVGATDAWAREASEAFARGFLLALDARGHVADRR
jgi:hypothetical protein